VDKRHPKIARDRGESANADGIHQKSSRGVLFAFFYVVHRRRIDDKISVCLLESIFHIPLVRQLNVAMRQGTDLMADGVKGPCDIMPKLPVRANDRHLHDATTIA